MSAYYNEIDPYAAQWLRNLIAAGLIADGVVDERSITEVEPEDLTEFTQCHFFAGIGVWSLALRNAGWLDDRAVWTGSCPCQPFSVAGNRKGRNDERHLWPAWQRLITQRRPPVIFAEQVASSAAVGTVKGEGENVWIDIVQADLENASYAVAAFDLPAAGFGAPHLRQRLWVVAEHLADNDGQGAQRWGERRDGASKCATGPGGLVSILGYAGGGACKQFPRGIQSAQGQGGGTRGSDGYNHHRHTGAGQVSSLVDTDGGHACAERQQRGGQHRQRAQNTGGRHEATVPGATNGFWSGADWLGCTDHKFRAVEPGTFPLVNGAANRVGKLRAYGNAICAEVATGFIETYIEYKGTSNDRDDRDNS